MRFDILVAEAIERARLHAPQARFEVEPRADARQRRAGAAGPRRQQPARQRRQVRRAPSAPIEVRLHDGELEVRDHGPGIDADDLPHVFDRFFRGARSRALPGSGLGLAIVRQVAELHAGSVSADAAPGGGTVVRMRVPTTAWGT